MREHWTQKNILTHVCWRPSVRRLPTLQNKQTTCFTHHRTPKSHHLNLYTYDIPAHNTKVHLHTTTTVDTPLQNSTHTKHLLCNHTDSFKTGRNVSTPQATNFPGFQACFQASRFPAPLPPCSFCRLLETASDVGAQFIRRRT